MLEHGDLSGLSKETVVDIWLNSDDAIRVLDKGYKIIHAAVEYFYLVSPLPSSVQVTHQLMAGLWSWELDWLRWRWSKLV